MRNNSNHKGKGLNDPFDQWLRGQKPPDPEFVKNMDAFLYGVKQKRQAETKFRRARLKKRLVGGSAVMCVVLISLSVFNFQDVGSDGFKLLELENPDKEQRSYQNEFRGGVFNVWDDETGQVAEELNHQFAAKEGVVVELEGWVFRGQVRWYVSREYIVQGESNIYGGLSVKPETILTRKFHNFLCEQWPTLKKPILSGELKPSGKLTTRNIDDVLFSVTTWVMDSPDGEIIYYKGSPIHR